MSAIAPRCIHSGIGTLGLDWRLKELLLLLLLLLLFLFLLLLLLLLLLLPLPELVEVLRAGVSSSLSITIGSLADKPPDSERAALRLPRLLLSILATELELESPRPNIPWFASKGIASSSSDSSIIPASACTLCARKPPGAP